MKFAIVIPTYNRLDKLKLALSKIESQVIPNQVEVFCLISNIASSDGTTEFLETLSKGANGIKYIINNKKEKNININFRKSAENLPSDIDWVWFHGDDDYFYANDAIAKVTNIILENNSKDLTFIHACQARRSRLTGAVYKGNLFNLCNSLGYHEMLGWMSSIVMRRDRFVSSILESTETLKSISKQEEFLSKKISAYMHSAAIFKNCFEDQAIFVDLPLIEPQDDDQTQESLDRWANEHMAERYFFVIDDLVNIAKTCQIKDKCSPIFFRYLSYSFWDRYYTYLHANLIKRGVINDADKQHWERLRLIVDFLGNSRDKKMYLAWYETARNLANNYENSVANLLKNKDAMFNAIKFHNAPNYPFQVLEINGKPPK